MFEDRENSSSTCYYSYLNLCFYMLDCSLFLFVIPINGVLFWATVNVALDQMQHTRSDLKTSIVFGCAFIYILLHLISKSIYKFMRSYVRTPITFFIISKVYIYVCALCGTVVYIGFYEQPLSQMPNNEDLIINALIMIVSFVILFSIKCRPHLATISNDIGKESTVEDVFLFPFRLFDCSVILTDYVGNRIIYFFSSRLYTEIFGIASVCSWYGIWTAFDTFAGANLNVTIGIVLISYLGLFYTKTVRNIIASPFAIITDKKQGYFDVPTLFQRSFNWKRNKFLYILDSVFSIFIVGTLVILVWRGAWCVLDQTVSPNEYELSGWISLVFGYLIVLITFILQTLIKKLIKKYQGWKRLIILDIYVIISFCGTINIWRGIWILLEKYAELENSLRNCLLLHFLSFFLLVVFNSSNTLLVRGVYIDTKENGEDCIEFPCYYFRLRFQEKQKKKTLVELKKLNVELTNLNKNSSSRSQETKTFLELTLETEEIVVKENSGNFFENNEATDKPFISFEKE